jgi:hypothetical protein
MKNSPFSIWDISSLLFPSIIYIIFLFFRIGNLFIEAMPLFAIIFIVFSFGHSKRNTELNKNSSAKDNYVKTLVFLATISFTISAVIIGIQTNIFAEHDKNFAHKNRLKWFKADEILKFPISQYNLVNGIPIDTLVVGKDAPNRSCFLFVIDKTQSNTESPYFKKISDKLKESVDQSIKDYYGDCENGDDILIDKTVELLWTKIMSEADSKSKIAAYVYDGQSKDLLPMKPTYLYNADINDLGILINDYKNRVNKVNLNHSPQITNLNEIILDIYNELQKPYLNIYDNINLCVVSDFFDDIPDSISIAYSLKPLYYEKALEKIACLDKVKKLSLISFPTHYPCQKSEVSKNLFFAACNTVFPTYKEIHNISLNQPDQDVKFIINELKDDFKTIKVCDDQVTFYYPYSDQLVMNSAMSCLFINMPYKNVSMKLICTNLLDNEVVKLICKDGINGNKMLFANADEYIESTLSSSMSFTLSGNTFLNLKNLYLELTYKDSSKKQMFKISLEPNLPQTTSLYLIICYTIFIICISLLILLPSFIHTFINTVCFEKHAYWYRKKYLLIIGFVLVFNFWYVNNLFVLGIHFVIGFALILAFISVSIWLSFNEANSIYKRNYCDDEKNKTD